MPIALDPVRATAYLWHALGCLSNDELDGRLLLPGRVKVAAAIDACIEQLPLMVIVGGDLVVEPGQSGGFHPDLEHLLAIVLDHVSFGRRVVLHEDLTRHVSQHHALPPVHPQLMAAARTLIERLRSAAVEASPKRVRFERKVVR